MTDFRRLIWTPASRWRLFRFWDAVADMWTALLPKDRK